MKKIISFILFIVLLFSFTGCGTETESQTTTTQVSTTVIETSTKSGISKEKAIELARDQLNDLVDEEFWDEYDLVTNTSDYELTFSFANYNDANEQWKVEFLGKCLATEFGTGKYLGYYAFEAFVNITKDGKVNGAAVTGLGRM